MTDTQILLLIIGGLGLLALYLMALVIGWKRTAYQQSRLYAEAHQREKRLQKALAAHNPWQHRGQAPSAPWGRA